MSQKSESEERAGPPRHDPDWKPAGGGDGRTMPVVGNMIPGSNGGHEKTFRAMAEEAKANRDERINSPKHYVSGRLETIYKIEDTLGPEGFKAYCLGNVIKYTNRHEHKGGDEDLKKAQVYLGWAIHGLPEPVDGRVPR